ncbi:cyclin-domain-containing protein [Tothia fuscella]|uniref:Cyclin-domain-containing protein n=1 Tax=Tothia fuscella TaxID=1048955 RepID=A0A9P4NGY2_9PEZI|nr:cyclin-domain-containing protein [Tothia fuscella]
MDTATTRGTPTVQPVGAPKATPSPSLFGRTTPPPPEPRVDPEVHTPPPSTTETPEDATPDVDPEESPQKRARAVDPGIKIMPLDYMKCEVKDLGILISGLLNELVRINDPLPFKNDQLTRFHSRAPPGISIQDYLNRLIVHATLYPPILLSMVYYIDRLCVLYPTFNISSLTVHRFLISSATVAAKGLSDSFWTNNTYARVGGISVKELALLELEFLQRMDWKIIPQAQVLDDYYRSLVDRTPGYRLEGSQTPDR